MNRYARIAKIKNKMIEIGVPEEIITKINFPEGTNGRPNPEKTVALINQMDELLTEEQRLLIMQEQGCFKSGEAEKAHRGFGREHKNKSIKEKIELLNKAEIPHNPPCRLNDDGTLSIFWSYGSEGNLKCVCGIVNSLKQPQIIPLTFCGCCGAHARSNFQKSLGVELKMKEIVSSAANSKGEKQCEFLFGIIG